MKDKKDIGRLFGEKLADFEVEPKNSIWMEIEKTLRRKRRIRLGIIWFSSLLGLFLLVVLFNYWQETDASSETENTSDSITNDSESLKIEQNKAPQQNSLVVSEKDTVYQNTDHKSAQDINDMSAAKEEKEALDAQVRNTDKEYFPSTMSFPNSEKKKDITNSNEKDKEKKTSLFKRSLIESENNTDASVISGGNHPDAKDDGEILSSTSTEESNQRIIVSTDQSFDKSKKQLSELVKIEKNSVAEDSAATIPTLKRKRKKDSSIQKTKTKEELNKYYLFPVLNSSIYTNLKKASAIDERLNTNRKSTVLRMGYGAYFVFKIPSKWSVRVGLSHTAIQKNTFDVPVAPGMLNTNYYQNIDFEEGVSFISFSNTFSGEERVTLEEKLAYLKFPVEVTYTLWESEEWGFDAITGLSVSFLGKNRLSAVREDGTTTILGYNNNYSKGNFGVHFGSGLYYKLNPSIDLRTEALIEPRFGFLENVQKSGPVIFNIQLGAIFRL